MRPLITLALALILSACSHTNELKKHTLAEKTVEYKYALFGEALETPVEQVVGALFDDEIGSGANHVIAATVASKLHRLAKPEQMSEAISQAMSEGVSTYLKLSPDRSGASDYIFETVLDEYHLKCTEEGLEVEADVRCRLLGRETSKAVWDDRTTKTVYWVRDAVSDIQVEAISCRELATMSDDEIRQGLDRIAGSIASSMIETMREDAVEFRD